MTRTALGRLPVAVAALLLVASAAAAQSVHEIQAGADTVNGDIVTAGEVDRIPIRLVDAATLSVTLKAAKGSALLPTLTLLGKDRLPDGVAGALVKYNAKGNVLTLKNYLVSETGLRWLEIRSSGTSTGGWTLSTKVKYPKGFTRAGTVQFATGPRS